MAVEERGGTVLGRPIQILTADHQNKPDVGATIARRWLDVDKIDAFAEVQNSAVAIATANLATAADRVALMSAPGSSDLTGKFCTPLSIQWTWDGYAAVRTAAAPLLSSGIKSWFLIVPDYNFGISVAADARQLIEAAGGSVLGEVRVASGITDFSSELLQAQSSGAQAIMVGLPGADAAAITKQASEFGILSGAKFVSLVTTLTEVDSVGLQESQGLLVPEAFYWDLSPATRDWSKRFALRAKTFPNSLQAGVYGGVAHLLKAMDKAGTTEGRAVRQAMADMPINDMMTRDGVLRPDGRVIRDYHLFRVKAPTASRYPHDDYDLISTSPGAEAFRPMRDGKCPFIQNFVSTQ